MTFFMKPSSMYTSSSSRFPMCFSQKFLLNFRLVPNNTIFMLQVWITIDCKASKIQLPLQTYSCLVIGFMVWDMLFSLMPFNKYALDLGSILRVPIGYWSNSYGASKLFIISFLFLILLVTKHYWFDNRKIIGIGVSAFSVGVTL